LKLVVYSYNTALVDATRKGLESSICIVVEGALL